MSGIARQIIRLGREGFEGNINPTEKVEVIPSKGGRTLKEKAHVHQSSHSLVHLHLLLSLWHHCHGRDEHPARERHRR